MRFWVSSGPSKFNLLIFLFTKNVIQCVVKDTGHPSNFTVSNIWTVGICQHFPHKNTVLYSIPMSPGEGNALQYDHFVVLYLYTSDVQCTKNISIFQYFYVASYIVVGSIISKFKRVNNIITSINITIPTHYWNIEGHMVLNLWMLTSIRILLLNA